MPTRTHSEVQQEPTSASPARAGRALESPGPTGVLQRQARDRASGPSDAAPARAPNRTGLPDTLKSGVESLSGLSLDAVRVHYGSALPARMNALAFTRGHEIHVAPGQERHLPHEAWHVVQQAQGRVAPTTQLKGVDLNADAALEREADQMGAKALATRAEAPAGDLSPAMPSSPVVQRAIGFEFEFGDWESTHTDGSRLTKGEEIARQGKFKVEGEDADAGKSAVEFVFSPLLTASEARTEINQAEIMAAEMWMGKRTFPGFNIKPGKPVAKMQSSPAIPLDKLATFYQLSQQSGPGRRTGGDNPAQEAIFKKYLGEHAMASAELRGFVALIVDYLIQGQYTARYNYPKSAVRLMARTSFTKMYSLIPEHVFFNDPANAGKWVDMVMETFTSFITSLPTPSDERVATEADKPALGATFHEMENLPDDADHEQEKYKLRTTRREWLSEMPTRDLLSKGVDKRFEGMGAYGDAADIFQSEDISEATRHAVDVMETIPEEREIEPAREAPLFEIRGSGDMFGIDPMAEIGKWMIKADEIFDLVDRATGGRVYGLGAKPVIAPDTDAPEMWEKAPDPPAPATTSTSMWSKLKFW